MLCVHLSCQVTCSVWIRWVYASTRPSSGTGTWLVPACQRYECRCQHVPVRYPNHMVSQADNAFMEGERGLPGKYQPCLCALVRSDTVDSDTRWCQEYDALFCADSEKLLTYHRGNSYLISNQDCANEVRCQE